MIRAMKIDTANDNWKEVDKRDIAYKQGDKNVPVELDASLYQ